MSDTPNEIWCDTGLYYDYKTDWSEGSWRNNDNCGGVKYVRADHIEKLEAKLAKCQALMHAGFAEYKRRLTRAVKALELADAALSGANMNMSVVEREVKATIAELEGELDD